MWRVDQDKAYPFRHKHPNNFPPPPRTEESESVTTLFEEVEVPIVFFGQDTEFEMQKLKPHPLSLSSQPPSVRCPDEPPPTPSAAAPAHLTSLLQEVLGIMNSIMDQKHIAEAEDMVLRDLSELVAIMQEEAETLVDMAGLVEEYVDKIEITVEVGEIRDWGSDLDLGRVGSVSSEGEQEPQPRRNLKASHEREDSGVGPEMDEDSEIDSTIKFVQEVQPRKVQVAEMARTATTRKSKKGRVDLESVSPVRKQPQVKLKADQRSLKSTTGSRNVKKGRQTKAPPQFRDSALGLMSSSSSPSPRTRPRPARWI